MTLMSPVGIVFAAQRPKTREVGGPRVKAQQRTVIFRVSPCRHPIMVSFMCWGKDTVSTGYRQVGHLS